MSEREFDDQQFRTACSRFPTGVTIATVMRDDGTPGGLTVNSFTSVSLRPPLVLICVHRNSHLLQHFRRGCFGINILSQEQRELSTRFSRWDSQQFHSIEWRSGQTGVPLIEGVLAFFECRLCHAVVGGDHEILVGEVVCLSSSDGSPLLRFGSADWALHQHGTARTTGSTPPAQNVPPLESTFFSDSLVSGDDRH